MDSQAARRVLEEGHRVFRRIAASGGAEAAAFGLSGDAPAQRPFAALIGCSDARVPPELLFRRSPNELFVIRVAGNALGEDVLGSLDYALHHLAESLRLIVVLGHSGCGAITAAVDVYLQPIHIEDNIDSRSVRSLVHRLLLPVHAAAGALAQSFGPDVTGRAGYRRTLVELGVVTQAALAAFHLQVELAATGTPGVEAVWGVYDVGRQQVGNPLATADPDDGVHLQPAPRSAKDFALLRGAIAGSNWVRELLDT